jgi:outer membrane protein OmpA-like peptidoglycan-associated protein/Tol biopolymer transport system component
MRNLKYIFSLLFIGIGLALNAQVDLSFKAQKLGSEINSGNGECAPVLSPDGSKMYFVRVNHPDNRYGTNDSQDIWVSQFTNGKWQEAVRLPNEVNLSRYNAIYGVMENGDLIINGIYDKKGKFVKRGISTVSFDGTNYGAPQKMKIKKYSQMSSGKVTNLSIDPSGTKMFISFSKKNKSKTNNIYLSIKKGDKWSKPKKIKDINSKASDETPFLSQDGAYLYFSSNRGNEKDNFDMYVSQTADINEFKNWSEPTKLEGDYSKGGYDAFLVIDKRGEYAYFASQRDGSNGSDIYQIQLKDVRDYVLVKGFVVNTESKKLLDTNEVFQIQVQTAGTTGQPKNVDIQNLRIVKDSVFFEYQLPFGTEYNMIAKVQDYEEVPVKIDLKEVTKYKEVKQNAMAKAVPIMSLTGKLGFENGDGTENFDSVKIFVDGEPYDKAVINPDGTYSLELPTGKKYHIEAKKKGHISYPVDIDVTQNKTRVSKTADLKMEHLPETFCFLDSRVLSKKDSSKLDPSNYHVFVNGKEAPSEICTKTVDGFTLQLEMGKKHFIMVKSPVFIEAHDSLDFRKTRAKEHKKADFYLTPIEIGATVQIKHIYFDLGKATLKPESNAELDRLVELLKEHDHLVIEIGGHTDNKGNSYLNQKLSGERALAVKNYLINVGKISEKRLQSKGYGYSKPVSPNDTEANRAKNRRVEFIILSND